VAGVHGTAGASPNSIASQVAQEHFGHGSFAQQMLVPTENAFPIGPIDSAQAGQWCALNLCLVPYGGLLAGNLQAGETILISGATGNFGSAGVAGVPIDERTFQLRPLSRRAPRRCHAAGW
jgi:alcohol dehydrogenase